MKITDLKLIEKHWAKLMSSSEISEFEKRLEVDLELKKEYDAFQQLRDALELENALILQRKIKGVVDTEVKSRRRYVPYVAAACFALLAGWFVYLSLNSSDEISQYYTPYTETTSILGTGDNDRNFENCIELYNEGDYELGSECFAAIESKNENTIFYHAMSLFNLKQYKTAKELLLKVEKIEHKKLEESNWYLALIYLQTGDKIESKRRLLNIVNNQNSEYKKTSASQLLEKI